ncbi:BnaA02g16440D [Brassica napus]|uniref:(rape) hypothetical protein n=1 Tax=Brassica napus TaxID=3708 RepID=A0A078J3K8_BRANA|nr:unnamed protein product [Brassica napus]CDY58313.1 BnaA02g16440D [Brassica napus]
MAKQNATSGTLASREFYKESSQPSNALKKTTVALEQSLRDINGGRDINEIISEVDGEKFGKAFSFQLKLGDFNFTFQLKLGEFNVTSKHQTFTVSRIITEHERDAHGPDDNGDVAKLAKDVAPPNGESVKKKARQE